MATNIARNNPVVLGAALEKNIFEHISLMAQEQLELEFTQEIQQLMHNYNKWHMQMNPQCYNKIRRYQQQIM